MTVALSVEKLGLVRAALRGLGDGNPVALAAASSLLEVRDLTVAEARVRLKAELVVLEGLAVKGRGGKALSLPGAAAPPGAAPPAAPGAPAGVAPPAQPGEPNGQFDQLHPRGTGGVFVRKGDSGEHVAAMQARLTELGHPAGTDGKFGSKEQKSVKAFQKQHGLPQSGIVDHRTLELMRLPPNATHTQSSAALRAALLAAGQTSKPGDVGQNVSMLQGALASLGFQISDPAATYGPGTEAAVRQLQARAGLAATGRMDEQTAALLAQATPAVENHGNLAADDAASWGLKPQGHRAAGRMTSTPAARANPRRNPSPRRGAPGKGASVKESEYDGDTSADGSRFVAKVATILDVKPPNLRKAGSNDFAACASCVFFSGASCDKYGGYPVDRGDICDDWLTVTPKQDRPDDSGDVSESTLDTKERKALPSSAFAIPESRSYPIHDEAHARNALARVAQNGSPAEQAQVRAAVKRRYPDIKTEESAEIEEVKSSVYPGLDRSPKKNWVDNAGGLPSYIERIAKHLHYEKGKDISTAIAIAVSTVKRWCSGGGASTHGGGVSNVSAKTKAQACAAVAQWEAKKGKAKASVKESIEEALADLEYVAWASENSELRVPSLRFCETLLEAVQALYSDWDDPPPTPPAFIWAQEEAWTATRAVYDDTVEPFMRVVEGTPILFVAGCPVRTFGSISEASGTAAMAASFSAGVRKKNAKRTKERSSSSLRRGLHPTDSQHNPADLDVHATVSKRFAGPGAKPRTLVKDVSTGSMQEGTPSPDLAAGSGEGTLTGGAAGRSSRVLALAESMFNEIKHPRSPSGEFRNALTSLGFKPTYKSPIGYAGDSVFAGHGLLVKHDPKTERITVHTDPEHYNHEVLADLPDSDHEAAVSQVQGLVEDIVGQSGSASPAKATSADDSLSVDQAIGKVLQSYPGLSDWGVTKGDDGWHVTVTMKDGVHHFHIANSGTVFPADEHGVPKPEPVSVPAPEPAPKATGYQLTGAHEKPYHMDDGQVYQSAKGGFFKKLASGKMTSAKGWTGAGVHVHDLQTDEKKWIPAFVLKNHLPLAVEPGAELPAAPKEKPAGELFGDLMSSVHGGGGGGELASLSGKNVVVTGKIPGYTRDEVHAMLKSKGAIPQSSVGADTHVLITGEKVGATKTKAAAAKGAQVVDWGDIAHLVEAGLTPRVRRIFGFRAELEEAASADEQRSLYARLDVLEGRLDAADRAALGAIYPTGLARFGITTTGTARVRRA